VPTVHPGHGSARDRHGENSPELGLGWCLPCYESGAFTLAANPAAGAQCAVHGRDVGPERSDDATCIPDEGRATIRAASPGRRPPRGRAWREIDANSPPARARLPRRTRRALDRSAARALARARAYGRRRACARVDGGDFTPHPGWRHFIAQGWRVLVDQREAWKVVEDLVDAEDWRADKRASWLLILRQLVYSMDWDTGLITGVTAARLGDAGGRATRTVSRVLAWARDVGLVVVVEHAASAKFLGSRRNRTACYALVTSSPPAPEPPRPEGPQAALFDERGVRPVDESGDLPISSVSSKPSKNGRRLEPAGHPDENWPVYAIPTSPAERSLASQCLLTRLGLDRRGVSGVPLWRTRALLKRWFDDGACVAGLLFALEHHPDRPNHHRGDMLRGARDPLRVIGHRLRPWRGRLSELPSTLTGIRGDYRQKKPQTSPTAEPTRAVQPGMGSDVRRAAQAAVDAHLRLLSQRRAKR
jgi:hypothetical protein